MNHPARLIVVGSVNVDEVVQVRSLPCPGETVLARDDHVSPGGKGANQAAAAAALDTGVVLVAAVGTDDRGAMALEQLERQGVDIEYIKSVPGRTGAALVMVDENGENMIVLLPGANDSLTPEDARSAICASAGPDTVILASCEIPIETVSEAARAAHETGARFVLNPAPMRNLPMDILDLCDVIVPNEIEAAQLLAAGLSLYDDGRDIVVTQGARGASVHTASGEVVQIPAPLVRVVDTTGAGDSFVAAFATALQSGLTVASAATVAAGAGALAVTGVGARGVALSRGAILRLLDVGNPQLPGPLRTWLEQV